MQAESLTHSCIDPQPATDRQPHAGIALEQGRLGLAELFDLLDAADWSLKAVIPALPALLDQTAMLVPANRFGWQAGLRMLWARHGWGMPGASQRQLMELAYQWDDWPLVIQVIETFAGKDGLSADDRYVLARAYWQLGDGGQALELLRPVLIVQPGDAEAYTLYRDIESWCRYRACYPFGTEYPVDDGELRLEPLGEHHLGDFAWQYYDLAIAELCCLPHFDSDQAWLEWLCQTYGYGDQLLFAVLHREWGFVGSVSLILHRGVGFFYYWIGAEFQGNGFGPRAVAMMLELAQAVYGLHACYAKSFADNYPSRRGLDKLGFQHLPVQPMPPHEGERYYRLGTAEPDGMVIDELRTLLDDMGSEVRLSARFHNQWSLIII
jgi:RimJ/RimL family protein N-acetyltransferase